MFNVVPNDHATVCWRGKREQVDKRQNDTEKNSGMFKVRVGLSSVVVTSKVVENMCDH